MHSPPARLAKQNTPHPAWRYPPSPRSRQNDSQLAAQLEGLSGSLATAAAAHTLFVRRALGLGAGASAVVTNGRAVELPLPAGTSASEAGAASLAEAHHAFEAFDFELLELFAQRNQYSGQAAALVRAAQQARRVGTSGCVGWGRLQGGGSR